MKFFDKLFGDRNDKKENADFIIFKQTFPKGPDFKGSKVYHIKSFQYTDINMELYEKHKYQKDFHQILERLDYNSQTNNVGLYYVVDSEGKGMVYLLADPFELFEKEYIMEQYEWTFDENIMELNSVKQIN